MYAEVKLHLGLSQKDNLNTLRHEGHGEIAHLQI